ncbi:MAG: hypothetical protein HY721_30825, partial [Planctomycetes bacterium]|nr:hypothetical protein [Planctomycetota bacterium]
LATGQFADPVRESDPRLVTFPILAVYLVVLAVPPVVYNLAFTRDHEASWVLRGAPLADPGGLGRGMAKALMAWIVAPACLGLFVACALAWRDPVSAALHAALAFVLSWPMALAALLVVLEGLPFSLPRARGGSLGPVAVPLAALSVALAPVTALHYAFARSPLFWAGAAAAGIAAACLLPRRADARLERLWRRPP